MRSINNWSSNCISYSRISYMFFERSIIVVDEVSRLKGTIYGPPTL